MDVNCKGACLPVIEIRSIEINYGDYTGTVFAAVQKGSAVIKVFMYCSNNFQMFHIFTIHLPKHESLITNFEELTEESDISRTALSCSFTKQAQHCIVTLLNGDVLVYALPPLPIMNDNFSNIDYTSNKENVPNMTNYLTPDYFGAETVKPPPQKNDYVEKLFYKNMNEVVVKDVNDVMMTIPAKFP